MRVKFTIQWTEDIKAIDDPNYEDLDLPEKLKIIEENFDGVCPDYAVVRLDADGASHCSHDTPETMEPF